MNTYDDGTIIANDDERMDTVEVNDKKKKDTDQWQKVLIGGAAGIMLGGGGAYAATRLAGDHNDTTNGENGTGDGTGTEATAGNLRVADVDQNQSFGEAFNEARAQVGPGGVFRWHGNTYSTYTSEEWSHMSAEEKAAFARQAQPMTQYDRGDYGYSGDHHSEQTAHHDSNLHQTSNVKHKTDPTDVKDNTDEHSFAHSVQEQVGDDVKILGETKVQGHTVVALDTNGDGRADVAIIDHDDSGTLSDSDIMVDGEGNHITIGEIRGGDTPGPTPASDDNAFVHAVEEEFGGNVTILKHGKVNGHEVVAVDVNHDGQPDGVLIDQDDDGTLSDPDTIITSEGETTVGDIRRGTAPGQTQEASYSDDDVTVDDGGDAGDDNDVTVDDHDTGYRYTSNDVSVDDDQDVTEDTTPTDEQDVTVDAPTYEEPVETEPTEPDSGADPYAQQAAYETPDDSTMDDPSASDVDMTTV